MCGRFVMLTFDEVLQVVQCLEFHTPFNALPDWPARPSAYPGSEAPVIVPGVEGLQARPRRPIIHFWPRFAAQHFPSFAAGPLSHRRSAIPSAGRRIFLPTFPDISHFSSQFMHFS